MASYSVFCVIDFSSNAALKLSLSFGWNSYISVKSNGFFIFSIFIDSNKKSLFQSHKNS